MSGVREQECPESRLGFVGRDDGLNAEEAHAADRSQLHVRNRSRLADDWRRYISAEPEDVMSCGAFQGTRQRKIARRCTRQPASVGRHRLKKEEISKEIWRCRFY